MSFGKVNYLLKVCFKDFFFRLMVCVFMLFSLSISLGEGKGGRFFNICYMLL